MFSYLLSRWRLSRSFEPHECGYLYRRRPTAEAILVTAAEKDQIFRDFRSAYWKSHAVLWISFIAGISLAIGLMVMVDAPPYAGTILGYGAVVVLLAAVIYVDRRVFNEAARSIVNRSAIKPSRNWFRIQDEILERMAWWRLVAGGLVLAVFAVLTFPLTASATWAAIAWFCYFGFCLGFWARNVWRKSQIAKLR
jgi:hypothetical protein